MDIYKVDGGLENSITYLKENKSVTVTEQKLIDEFIKDCQLGKHCKKRVGKHRMIRYARDINFFYNYFKKPFSKITENDVEEFFKALDENRIRKQNGDPYTNSSKNDIVKSLKRFGRWFYRNNIDKYNKLFRWIKEFRENVEIPALSREEIERIVEKCNARDSAIIMFLFDSGARVGEALNVKISDLTENKKSLKVRIRESKTKPRTINIPLAAKYVRLWLKKHPDKDNSNAFLFPIDYDSLRLMLKRKGKIIGKNLHPHLLRHSSATFYANLFKNPYKLDYRYGWIIGSDMSRRYIDRDGLLDEEVNELVDLDENYKLKTELNDLKKKVDWLQKQFPFEVAREEEHVIKGKKYNVEVMKRIRR